MSELVDFDVTVRLSPAPRFVSESVVEVHSSSVPGVTGAIFNGGIGVGVAVGITVQT